MVRHHAVRKHPATAKVLHQPHEHPENLPFVVTENELPIYNP